MSMMTNKTQASEKLLISAIKKRLKSIKMSSVYTVKNVEYREGKIIEIKSRNPMRKSQQKS